MIESGVEKEKAEQITAKKGLFGFAKTIERVIRYANKPDAEVKTVTDYESMNKMIENKVDDKKYDSWLHENISGLMQSLPSWERRLKLFPDRQSCDSCGRSLRGRYRGKTVCLRCNSEGNPKTGSFSSET